MDSCAIIATHHKTGTAWMTSTFKAICESLLIEFVDLQFRPSLRAEDVEAPIVVLDAHSTFQKFDFLRDHPLRKIVHLIRDPRDVIISAMHYHRVAKEKWLHIPKEEFGGLTYQEKLNSLSDDRQRYFFEMENSGRRTINGMRRWDYKDRLSFECKYEELINDREMNLFRRMVGHLGFSGSEIEQCCKAFWAASLFGGGAQNKGKTNHVRSGDARQWPSVFDREMAEVFQQKFGFALKKLGYESNDSWVHQIRAETVDGLAAG